MDLRVRSFFSPKVLRMQKNKVEEQIEELAGPVAESLGLEMVQVLYRRESAGWVLRILVDWVPMTHATASTRFDLPDPLGPTTTVTPGSNSRRVLSANDLNPTTLRDFKNTNYTFVIGRMEAITGPRAGREPAGVRHRRHIRISNVSTAGSSSTGSTTIPVTLAALGPSRSQPTMASTT